MPRHPALISAAIVAGIALISDRALWITVIVVFAAFALGYVAGLKYEE